MYIDSNITELGYKIAIEKRKISEENLVSYLFLKPITSNYVLCIRNEICHSIVQTV